MRDSERIHRIQQALRAENYDAVVCGLPSKILLLSGYFPVIGASIAIPTREGPIAVLAPEDQVHLAQRGWADELHIFHPSSLEQLATVSAPITGPLSALLAKLGLTGAAIAYESGEYSQPAS